jgi:protein-ribulosamine 3-kinase
MAWDAVAASIAAATGAPFTISQCTEVGGGCINRGFRVSGGGQRYFVKLNRSGRRDMLDAEAEGLRAIERTGTVRVPRPVCTGEDEQDCWLVLEYLELGRGTGAAMEELGGCLANLHRATADRFGWYRDNTIGATAQHNRWSASWSEFWRTQRLGFQLELAARNGHRGEMQRHGRMLLDRLDALLAHAPAPSLLHGDLWGGNAAATVDGEPVLFDPACYYGDREADLAMTELFGGFPPGFYAAYRDAWPLAAGYDVRRDLYNLYHVLNHLNLFGAGYRAQAEGMIERLLAEVR